MISPIAEYLIYGSKHTVAASLADIKQLGKSSHFKPDNPGTGGFRALCRNGYAVFFQLSGIKKKFPDIPREWVPGSSQGRISVYYTYRQQTPKSRIQSLYQKLLRMEMVRLVSLLYEEAEDTIEDGDTTYRVTLAMRKWMDYLVDCNALLQRGEVSGLMEECIIHNLKRMLAALICDTLYRYRRLPVHEIYTPATLYLELLDEPVPDPPEIIPSPYYYLSRMENAVADTNREETSEEIALDLMQAEPWRYKCAGVDMRWWEETAAHLANVRFLGLWQEPDFMEDNIENLRDSEFAETWVRGIGREIGEMKPDAEFVKKCWHVLEAMEDFFMIMEKVEGNLAAVRPEARKLTERLAQADRYLFSETVDVKSRGIDAEHAPGISENPFAEKLLNSFIPRQRLAEYLGLDSKATISRFFKESGLRYVELTPQKHLVYTEDVEELVRNKTGRYGG